VTELNKYLEKSIKDYFESIKHTAEFKDYKTARGVVDKLLPLWPIEDPLEKAERELESKANKIDENFNNWLDEQYWYHERHKLSAWDNKILNTFWDFIRKHCKNKDPINNPKENNPKETP